MPNTNSCTELACGSNGGIEPQTFMTEKDQKIEEMIAELTLLLISLTSWQEKVLNEKVTQAWKGYDFKILDQLKAEGYIFGSKGSKLVTLTDDGMKKAEELAEKYLK